MSGWVTFDTHALGAFTADLHRGGAAVEARASAAVRKTAADIQADASATPPLGAPRRFGNLSQSIGTSTMVTPQGIAAEIGPTANYGRYVEEGTHNADGSSRMAPRPYLRPAYDRRVVQLQAALTQIADTIL